MVKIAIDSEAVTFPRLFQPITIGTMTVRNRIVNTTHGSGLGEARDLRYIEDRAKGGVGLIGLHGSHGVATFGVGEGPEKAVPDWDERPLSPTTPEGIRHYDDVAIPYMRKRAEVVHAGGAVCFAQVYHLGNAPHAQRIFPPVAPSTVGDPYDALSPHPLSQEEIEGVIFSFAHGIRRVREAGIDAAEIHGAHGYLVNEFLSPYYNRRDDEWGGSRENRVRFVLRILEEARALVGDDFPIGIRVGLDGDGRRGLSIDELAATCKLLSPHVAYISVSGGNYAGFGEGYETAYVSPWYKEPGFNVPASTVVRANVDVPVIVTGRIADASIAESILADGGADMIGMVRALIADPELPNKARQGKSLEVRMCLGMSECHYIGPHRTPVNCAVNAAAGREKEMEIVPADVSKTIVIVGAGPAGMEAARVAALRGHHVYLSDKEREMGGTVRRLAADPNRRNLRDHAAFFELELRRLGVEFMFGNEVSADELAEFGPDAVVIATGGSPLIPDVAGIHDEGVLTALELVAPDGPSKLRERVLVVGGLDGHLAGPTMAEFVADQGKSVEFISEQIDFAPGAEDGTRLALLSRLLKKGVVVSTGYGLARVDGRNATVVQTFTGATREIEDVTVVLACGLIPNDRLATELKGRIDGVHVIGDALAPRRLMHANLEGARVGNLL
jgi:2,4-dienoyl-CoA reductase-like NADH-dependent reductase (Old Yellow Enzyme family)/thioredoxin reductase